MRILVPLIASLACQGALAAVQVSEAWARATVPGQTVGAVYLKIKSDTPAVLKGASCACAQETQIHEMQEKNGVASMRERKSLQLPPSRVVEFKPGGLHIMLFGLKSPLKAGQSLTLKLRVEEAGKPSDLQVVATVKDMAAHAGAHEHHHHHD